MKKIIAAIDGLRYSKATAEHAIYLAGKNNFHVVGVFIEDFTYHSYSVAKVLHEPDADLRKVDMLNETDEAVRQRSVRLFESACQEANIEYTIHHDKNFAIQDLLHESIYSDLLIIDSKESFSRFTYPPPTPFVRDLLSEAQCPVLVVADTYKQVEKLVILYDGEPSSVFAIKAFSYLLSSLTDLEAEIISVQEQDQPLVLPDQTLMNEFMTRHFPSASYTLLKGDAEKQILERLKKQDKNTIAVLGAYRRGRVSRWFRPSMADKLMAELNLPLFIAHNKG
jgi:nucleotide-binding universal stress UspA family protein